METKENDRRKKIAKLNGNNDQLCFESNTLLFFVFCKFIPSLKYMSIRQKPFIMDCGLCVQKR